MAIEPRAKNTCRLEVATAHRAADFDAGPDDGSPSRRHRRGSWGYKNSIYILTGPAPPVLGDALAWVFGQSRPPDDEHSACGSSRHTRRRRRVAAPEPLKRRTLFLYASPTTVNGALAPSIRRRVARARRSRSCGGGAHGPTRAGGRPRWPRPLLLVPAARGAPRRARRSTCRLLPSGASGAARRATKFVRSASVAAGVASAASRAFAEGSRRFWSVHAAQEHTNFCSGPWALSVRPAIGSSDLGRLVAALSFVCDCACAEQTGQTKMTVPSLF